MAISVHTEITDAARKPSRGWIFFDAECEFCRRWVARTEPIFAPRGFAFVPLEKDCARDMLRVPDEELLREMRVLMRNGERYGGADAIVALAKHVWWAWPLAIVARIPGIRRVLQAGYRSVASRRHCLSGRCAVSAGNRVLKRQVTDHEGGRR
jgi:predicted DCC family thiol-disulfide oxidoreductase YuxK